MPRGPLQGRDQGGQGHAQAGPDPLTPAWLITGPWLVFLAYWIWSARAVRPNKREESSGSRLLHSGLFAAGAVLLSWRIDELPALQQRFVPAGPPAAVAGAVLTVAGVGLAIWARAVLGANWSGRVTLKQGHVLIRSGPYAVVRHPIYTGILLGVLGPAIGIGQVRGLVGLGLFLAGVLLKVRVEERFLAAEFGAEYETYRRATRRLVPFLY